MLLLILAWVKRCVAAGVSACVLLLAWLQQSWQFSNILVEQCPNTEETGFKVYKRVFLPADYEQIRLVTI